MKRWTTEFLRLFKEIDTDLWETVGKNPVKFLKQVSQEKLEQAATNQELLKKYDKVVEDFDGYMNSKNTWFSNQYPENRKDLIAYFSAEYGLDETIPIYSGGLGILSGDHLKSASDLGLPLVGVGLLYKNGYFHQKINGYGYQETEYNNIELSNLPINPVKDENYRDIVYSSFLDLQQLNKPHKEKLNNMNFTDEYIFKNRFKSIENRSKKKKEICIKLQKQGFKLDGISRILPRFRF